MATLPEAVQVVLIDDGSETPATDHRILQDYLQDPRVHLLQHAENRGAAAARNTGIQWCRTQGIELVILLDSDCVVKPGFVEAHCRLHVEYPHIACIGAAIQGLGAGLWAELDKVISWTTSIPGSPMRSVNGMYHIPTTNMSLKLSHLPRDLARFDARLRTGEDVVFVQKLQQAGISILFHPTPEIEHVDRDTLKGLLDHQYRWGLHTYTVRSNLAQVNHLQRWILALGFGLCIPIYACLGSWLILWPWMAQSLFYGRYYLPLVLVYLVKGLAVLEGIWDPDKALHPAYRDQIGSVPNSVSLFPKDTNRTVVEKLG
jgi:glycosyltransferase involved in cell wall biosynthesis